MEEARGREVALIWRDPREVALIFESVRPREGPELTQEDLGFLVSNRVVVSCLCAKGIHVVT